MANISSTRKRKSLLFVIILFDIYIVLNTKFEILFTWKVERSSHGKTITCEAQNEAENIPQASNKMIGQIKASYQAASVKILVEFKSLVIIKQVLTSGSSGNMLKGILSP